jgi:hypothetical protein
VQRWNVGGAVLSITVQANHNVIIPALRKLETGLDGSSDAEVERMPNHKGAGRTCLLRRVIGGPVVNNQHVCVGEDATRAVYNPSNCRLLIIGGDEYQQSFRPD